MIKDATTAIAASVPKPATALPPRLLWTMDLLDKPAPSVRAAASSVSTRRRRLSSSLGSAGQSLISKFLSQAGQARLQLRLDRVLTDAHRRRRLAHGIALQVMKSDGGAHAPG
jgi:hypothetical protein